MADKPYTEVYLSEKLGYNSASVNVKLLIPNVQSNPNYLISNLTFYI